MAVAMEQGELEVMPEVEGAQALEGSDCSSESGGVTGKFEQMSGGI